MAIEIEVDTTPEVEEKKPATQSIPLEMNARRSLDGNIMIFDHIDMDIVYMPEKKKLATFAKGMMNDSDIEYEHCRLGCKKINKKLGFVFKNLHSCFSLQIMLGELHGQYKNQGLRESSSR